MLSINFNITLALILIIPFHGIFVCIFLFIRSRRRMTANFFLGLLLLVLSLLALFQLTCQYYNYSALHVSYYYFLNELVISPLIFLYNSVIIQPGVPAKIYLHMSIFTLNILIILVLNLASGSVYILIIVIFLVINGLYLAGSVKLLISLVKKKNSGLNYLPMPEYTRIIVFNLILSGTIILSTFLYLIFTVTAIHLAQIPKALVIYYTYFRIMNRADFSN
jgi:hypothetical protein